MCATLTIKLSADQEKRIKRFLKALPRLDLSDTGLSNIAKRFGTNAAVIKQMAEELNLKP